MSTSLTKLIRPVSVGVSAIVMILSLLACETSDDSSSIVATWHEGRLERADYERWLSFHKLEESSDAIREQVLVQSLAAISRTHGAEQELRTRLELEAMRQKVLIPALRSHVTADILVTDDEIEDLRHTHPKAYKQPRKLRLRNIYKQIKNSQEAPAVRKRMGELHAELLAGADFLKLAGRESESQTRFRDGHLGFLAPDELPPAIAAAVVNLEPQQISEVIEHDGGLTIFLCEEIREAKEPTPDEVRSKIQATITRQRGQQKWKKFQQNLYAEAAPTIHPHSEEFVLEMPAYQLSAEALPEIAALRVPSKAFSELTESELQRLLRSWAIGELSVRRAIALELDQTPEIAETLFWQQLGVLAHRELVRRIDARLKEPTEDELRHHFESHPQRYREPDAYDLAVIQFTDATDKHQRTSINQATEVVSLLGTGSMSFDEAAHAYSIHPSAEQGGHIGWMPRGQIVTFGPTASNAIRKMSPGENSGLLRLESGFWIFELRGQRDARPLPFEAVRERIRKELKKQQISELENSVRLEQLAAIELKINNES